MAGIETLAATVRLQRCLRCCENRLAAQQEKQAISGDKIAALVSQYTETCEKYLESDPNPDPSVEKRREDLLKQITLCHNRMVFEVIDPDLIARLVPFAISGGAARW